MDRAVQHQLETRLRNQQMPRCAAGRRAAGQGSPLECESEEEQRAGEKLTGLRGPPGGGPRARRMGREELVGAVSPPHRQVVVLAPGARERTLLGNRVFAGGTSLG